MENTFGLVDGRVRVGPLMRLPQLVSELGSDADLVFASAGFKPAQFANPDTEIPYVSASKLLAQCVKTTGCRHLGLLLGSRTDPSSLGIAGFILRSAETVGHALGDLVRYLDLHDRGAQATLATTDQDTSLGYTIYLSGVEATDQIYDLSMAIVCQIMRDLCGASWNPKRVLLSHRKPRNPVLYQQFFRAPIHFDSNQSAVVFAARWLDYPITNADPLLHCFLKREADEWHSRQRTDLLTTLHRLLWNSIATGKASAADLAKQLCIHERTLNRRLREVGTSFRHELESVRYEMARRLLADSQSPLSKIAETLGYASETSFSRAFKQWSGATPAQWRSRELSSK